jgi:hypothetical protein
MEVQLHQFFTSASDCSEQSLLCTGSNHFYVQAAITFMYRQQSLLCAGGNHFYVQAAITFMYRQQSLLCTGGNHFYVQTAITFMYRRFFQLPLLFKNKDK